MRVSHREDRLWRPEVEEAATGLEFLARAGLEYHMPAVLDYEEPLKVTEEGEQGAITVSRVDSKEAEKHSPRKSLWPL